MGGRDWVPWGPCKLWCRSKMAELVDIPKYLRALAGTQAPMKV